MNKGDTVEIILDYKCNGEDIVEGQFDEIELQLEEEKQHYQVKLLLSTGDIYWDADVGKYATRLEEKDTYKFLQVNTVKYQLRVLDGNNVYSSAIGAFEIGDVLSRKVLNVEG